MCKAERERHRQDKLRVTPTNKLIERAQASVNAYARLRDYYDPCMSCGKDRETIEAEQGWKPGGAWDAGHYRSRGAAKQLRLTLITFISNANPAMLATSLATSATPPPSYTVKTLFTKSASTKLLS